MRIKFKKGQQKMFFKKIIANLGCPSLRLLNQYGFNINYQTLKSYYNENRTLPEETFNNLARIGKINPLSLDIKKLEDNWGKKKGGKASHR